MFKISRLADYATLATTCLAQYGGVQSAKEIAQQTRLPETTVSKLCKTLTRAGLLTSELGITGGYRLAQAADDISVLDILEAVEGPLALTECNQRNNRCALESHCHVSHHWRLINHAVSTALGAVTVRDLCRPHTAIIKEQV